MWGQKTAATLDYFCPFEAGFRLMKDAAMGAGGGQEAWWQSLSPE